MNMEDKIKESAKASGKTLAQLAEAIGVTPANFSNKLKRDSFSPGELKKIAEETGATYIPQDLIPFVDPKGNSVYDLQESLKDWANGEDVPDRVYWYGMGRVAHYLLQIENKAKNGNATYAITSRIWQPEALQGKKDQIVIECKRLLAFMEPDPMDQLIAMVLGSSVDGKPDETAYILGAVTMFPED